MDPLKQIQDRNNALSVALREMQGQLQAALRRANGGGSDDEGVPFRRLYYDGYASAALKVLTIIPRESGQVSLYGDNGWDDFFLPASITLDFAAGTSGKKHAVYMFVDPMSTGTVIDQPVISLEYEVWTNETTRATALVNQDGVLLKSSDLTRRWIQDVYYDGTLVSCTGGVDPNNGIYFGTGDPNNAGAGTTGVGMQDPGILFGLLRMCIFAIKNGLLQAGFNTDGQLVWGAGNVIGDILGLLFAAPGVFMNFLYKAAINTFYVGSSGSLMALGLEAYEQNGTDVCVNGDAETGNTTGWTVGGTAAASTVQAHGGTYSFVLPNTSASLRQTPGTWAAKHPVTTFWYIGGSLNVNVEILDAASGQLAVHSIYLPAATVWTKSSCLLYNDNALTDKAQFTFIGLSASPVYIDDIKMLKLDNASGLYIGESYSTFNDIIRARARKFMIGNGSASAQTQMLDIRGTSYLGGDTTIAGTVTASNLSGTNTGDQTAAGLGVIPNSGWVSDANAWSYSSADSPTFVISINADMTGLLSVGMRIKLTQTTVKYFGVTAVGAFSGGATLVTVFGGTGGSAYTLANAAITLPNYSVVKEPFGWPMDKTIWRVITLDTSNPTQATPTAATFYNLGSLSISLPIGQWDTRYEVVCDAVYTVAAVTEEQIRVALSTANNSQSDGELGSVLASPLPIVVGGILRGLFTRRKILTIASKTSYFLNASASGTATSLNFEGGAVASTVIIAEWTGL